MMIYAIMESINYQGEQMGAIEYYSYSDYIQWEGDWELIYGYKHTKLSQT